MADVRLVAGDASGEPIASEPALAAHKVALCRAPFFARMLGDAGPKASFDNPPLPVPRVATQELRRIIVYVYTASAEEAMAGLDSAGLNALSAAAEACEMPELQNLCVNPGCGSRRSLMAGGLLHMPSPVPTPGDAIQLPSPSQLLQNQQRNRLQRNSDEPKSPQERHRMLQPRNRNRLCRVSPTFQRERSSSGGLSSSSSDSEGSQRRMWNSVVKLPEGEDEDRTSISPGGKERKVSIAEVTAALEEQKRENAELKEMVMRMKAGAEVLNIDETHSTLRACGEVTNEMKRTLQVQANEIALLRILAAQSAQAASLHQATLDAPAQLGSDDGGSSISGGAVAAIAAVTTSRPSTTHCEEPPPETADAYMSCEGAVRELQASLEEQKVQLMHLRRDQVGEAPEVIWRPRQRQVAGPALVPPSGQAMPNLLYKPSSQSSNSPIDLAGSAPIDVALQQDCFGDAHVDAAGAPAEQLQALRNDLMYQLKADIRAEICGEGHTTSAPSLTDESQHPSATVSAGCSVQKVPAALVHQTPSLSTPRADELVKAPASSKSGAETQQTAALSAVAGEVARLVQKLRADLRKNMKAEIQEQLQYYGHSPPGGSAGVGAMMPATQPSPNGQWTESVASLFIEPITDSSSAKSGGAPSPMPPEFQRVPNPLTQAASCMRRAVSPLPLSPLPLEATSLARGGLPPSQAASVTQAPVSPSRLVSSPPGAQIFAPAQVVAPRRLFSYAVPQTTGTMPLTGPMSPRQVASISLPVSSGAMSPRHVVPLTLSVTPGAIQHQVHIATTSVLVSARQTAPQVTSQLPSMPTSPVIWSPRQFQASAVSTPMSPDRRPASAMRSRSQRTTRSARTATNRPQSAVRSASYAPQRLQHTPRWETSQDQSCSRQQ
eukprot:TRINITY_DN15454_c0_g1_i2.p1 TRINITY_DN15454_c0_g1~~TRINITY_DN15454_c0_g1_i2.p1  ORF type:complete len:954 (-),score=166.46 TRINITY_DN15454_c0_g1_i2:67-2739(-)